MIVVVLYFTNLPYRSCCSEDFRRCRQIWILDYFIEVLLEFEGGHD